MATILIVDDHETNRLLLTTLLGYRNHRVVEASDGAEGLERARATRPDLIITDVLMPTMDGYEFTRRLREEPVLAATPVIFYSAQYLMQDARSLAAKCGVEYVVAKPAEAEELLRTVAAALGLSASPGAPIQSFEDFDRLHVRVLTDKVSAQAEEVSNLNARLEALIDVARELNVARDPWSLVERYTREACKVIGAACASACITDESGRPMRHFCSRGVELADPEHACPACAMGGPVAEALRQGALQRSSLHPANPAAPACPAGVPAAASYLVVPILTRTHSYGWLSLGNKIGNSAFTVDDETLLMTLAAQLAMGYENSRLFDELNHRAEDLEHEVAERRQSSEKYRMVVEQASDGIAITDERGGYLEVNPKMLDMLGYSRDGFLRLNVRDLIPSEDLVNDPIPFEHLHPGKVFQSARRLIRSDGSFLEVEISTSSLEDGRVLAIARDVTDRKRLEADLRQSQKLEAVGRLAGGVAHDFNNLLTVILGHSDLALANLDANDRRRRDIENIREAGARAAVLTGQMLAFSRKQVLQPKVLSVDGAVANLTKMLGRLITSNIEIVTRQAAETWYVKVDPGQLDQVILNLALNARDAMPLGGRVVIETKNRRVDGGQIGHSEAPAGDYVTLSVSDTGTGMNAETRSHLFEPFFTTKMLGKGTGLGLSTVYGIVRQSEGYIAVESELGRGTTLEIYLPRVLDAGETARPRAENGSLPLGHEVVLLAEDEERVRSLVAIVLAQQGYKVIEACDGQQALEIAERCAGEIHLLFSDIMMPRISGLELAERLRRARPGIKVLLMSGYTGDVVAHGALDPSIPVLQKPFTARALASKVREVLDATEVAGWPEDLTDGAKQPAPNDAGLHLA